MSVRSEGSRASSAAASAQVPAIATSSLLQAIATATITGNWGDACFVVKRYGGDFGYDRLWTNLNVLRANGADYLVDLVTRTGHRTLEDAVSALRQHPAPNTDPQRRALTLAPPAAAPHAVPGHTLYFPVTQICLATMRGILTYLQTGHIQFAPLSSTLPDMEPDDVHDVDDASIDNFVDIDQEAGQRDERATQPTPVHQPASAIPMTSPKSVYRAARKFRLLVLRNLASEAIEQQITPANCLVELFEDFSLKIPEMYEKRLCYVLQHWNEIGTQERNSIMQLVASARNRTKANEAFNTIMANTLITNKRRA